MLREGQRVPASSPVPGFLGVKGTSKIRVEMHGKGTVR